jgi:hypothetical protein
LIESEPSAHNDTDSAAFSKLPTFDPAAGLSSVINNSTGGTASDANGFIHPLGDHAQFSYIFDGQVISDQQSKVFSTRSSRPTPFKVWRSSRVLPTLSIRWPATAMTS